MDLSVQIHADNISGARRAIVLTKTARNKVRLDLEPPIALGLVRSIDFKNVRADPTSIAVFCPTRRSIFVRHPCGGATDRRNQATCGDDQRVKGDPRQWDLPLTSSPQATMTKSAISYNRLSSLSYKMAGPHF